MSIETLAEILSRYVYDEETYVELIDLDAWDTRDIETALRIFDNALTERRNTDLDDVFTRGLNGTRAADLDSLFDGEVDPDEVNKDVFIRGLPEDDLFGAGYYDDE